MEYLTLPYRLRHDFLRRGDIEQSIKDSIGLILSTRTGTMPFMREFGCSIWEKEYSDLFSSNKSDIRASLRNAIDQLERRLYNLSVSFSPDKRAESHAMGMHVKVTGTFRDEGEEKKFEAVYRLV